MKQLEIKLHGQIGDMDTRALSDAISAVTRMLQSVSGEESDQLITLQDLRVSSVIAVVNATTQQVETIGRGLESLQHEASIPHGWDQSTLTAVKELHKANRRAGVESVHLGLNDKVLEIDQGLAKHASEAEGTGPKSLGSVSGLLYRYSSRNGVEAGLIDDATQKPVNLVLSEDTKDDVIALLDKSVTAWGILMRHLWDDQIVQVKVSGIEAARSADQIRRPAHEGRGILGEYWLDGQDPVTWVRGLRDQA